MRQFCGVLAVIIAVAALGVCSTARAGMIPTNVTVTPDAGNFRWDYSVSLSSNVQIQTGDYFTIYDFGGLVTGPGGTLSNITPPVGWNATTSMVGQTPPGLAPIDKPDLPNLTFTYSGPTAAGPFSLGDFWAVSTMGMATTADFTSVTHTQVGRVPECNITTTSVPVAPNIANSPEPATLAMFGLGLPVLGLGRWLRRRLAG